MKILKIEKEPDFPSWLSRQSLAEFLSATMEPFNDNQQDSLRGIDYALSDAEGKGGFIMVGEEAERPLGALVMLDTGMKGFVPQYLLLFVAVVPEMRGKGLGRKLCEAAIAETDGDVALHVEYDNPARRLYERLGFSSKYAEMRLEQ